MRFGAKQASKTLKGVPASFRDPGGRLFSIEGRLLRFVNSKGSTDLTAFLESRAASEFFESGRLVQSRVLNPREIEELNLSSVDLEWMKTDEARVVVEHRPVSFQSFPHEWPSRMLHAAAQLTLDLAERSLQEGFGLKDATPHNILFEGPKPIFVDLLSFERRDREDAIWLPYAQFLRTFLLPLLACRSGHYSLDRIFLTSREGIEPEELYSHLHWFERLRPPFLTQVSIPKWLSAGHNPDGASIYQKKRTGDSEKARFILSAFLGRLRRLVGRLEPIAGQKSRWADYVTTNSYSAEALTVKRDFVETALREYHPTRVLDVGANQGMYSEIAAKLGSAVIAIDTDPVVLNDLWRRAYSERLDILPLVVNLARPSPALGWRNEECLSFLDRARGHFDCVLMLAVIHHLIVTERIPLADILDLAAELTTSLLVIEFVGPDDFMFQRITRGREALHRDLSVAEFESACQKRFRIIRSESLPGSTRSLYLLRKIDGLG